MPANKPILFLTLIALLLLMGVAPLVAQEAPDLSAKIEITAESDETVTIRHELGETEIPKNPQRIVAVTGTAELEALLTLGVKPAAASGDDGDNGTTVWPGHVEALLDGVEQLPSRRNVNLELVLAAQPDLIIGSVSWIGEIYDDLSAIAPTIALDFGREWQAIVRDVAILVNQVDRGESVIADYDARVDALVEQYRPAVEGMTYTQIKSFISEGQIQLYTQTNVRSILDRLGMVQPDEQIQAAAETEGAISLERIDLFDTDVIFIFHYPGSVEQGEIDALKANPLFANFDAVQQGRVFEVISSWWYLQGAIGSQVLLDDLEQTILPALTGAEVESETQAAATSCEAGYRLFDHEYLAGDPICIPENPQRILALEMSALEMVLLADKELVGTANWLHEEVPVLLPELSTALEGIADTGYPANLEVALEAQPDLILAVDGDIDLAAGNEIAPVVMPLPGIEHDWKLSMEFWSEVLGTQDLYAEMLANYEARIAEFKAALASTPTVSIIGTSSYGTYMWLEDTAPGVVVADAGLLRPESQALTGDAAVERYGEQRWIQISEERFDLANADDIFVFTYATTNPDTLATEDEAMAAFKANPIWNSLSAVAAEHVYYVGPHWWRAQTYLLANKVLDDLFVNLTGTSAATPVLSDP